MFLTYKQSTETTVGQKVNKALQIQGQMHFLFNYLVTVPPICPFCSRNAWLLARSAGMFWEHEYTFSL